MKTIFWIAILAFIVWCVFRNRSTASKHSSTRPIALPTLRDSTNLGKPRLPTTRPISKKETWMVGPDEVFKSQYVSFTRIKTFEKCPRMFELTYLYGFDDKSGRAAQVGSLVHKIVHLYTLHHRGRLSEQLGLDGAVEGRLGFYDHAVASTNLTYHIPKSELRRYLVNFVGLNRMVSSQIRATEHECNSTIGGFSLKCIIDRIDIGPQSTPIIIDYKTGNPQNVVNHQLDTYAYALCDGKWTAFTLVFQFLKNGEVRDWQYTPQLHNEAERWLLQRIAEVENSKVFRRNKSRLCDYCGVSEHCYRVS